MKKTINIEGMTCQNCVRHATEALEELSGVSNVSVDLDSKSAVVETSTEITDEMIKKAVSAAGYSVSSIN